MAEPDELSTAVAGVPPGGWCVGVSGGADSVALLMLLRQYRPDLPLHVVHLDHQLRGEASTADATFVRGLADQLGVPCTVETRQRVEASLHTLPRNASSRYRAARLALFRRVTAAQSLRGVLLAHHADDLAETVFVRLLRGSSPAGLTGIVSRATVGGLLIVRPLLALRRAALRAFLSRIGQDWREDESNVSSEYLRNRVRALLSGSPGLTEQLLALSDACGRVRQWVRSHAPELEPAASIRLLADLPPVLARESARRWLVARGVPEAALTPAVVDRLIRAASDAATPPRQHFPGGVLVRRREGRLFVAE